MSTVADDFNFVTCDGRHQQSNSFLLYVQAFNARIGVAIFITFGSVISWQFGLYKSTNLKIRHFSASTPF